MAIDAVRRHQRLVITFGGSGRPAAFTRGAVVFILAVLAFHLGFGFATGADPSAWREWGTSDLVVVLDAVAILA
jgi:hypothetical protein